MAESAGREQARIGNLVWGREIPFKNPHFTGRDKELADLRRQLVTAPTAVIGQPPIPLYGLGGVGKTEIAAEYAHRHREDYALCWWVRCEREALIVNSLLSLGKRLQLPDFRVEERDYSVNLVIDALNKGYPFPNWLLIFDNATNAEMVLPYLPRGSGHVIITSRDIRWRRALHVDGIEVSEFESAETVEFLRKRVPALAVVPAEGEKGLAPHQVPAENERRSNNAAQLAEELANLPLAAEHAAAYLAETGASVPQYLELYRTNAHEMLGTDLDISYPYRVATTWSVSRRMISREADALFNLLAFFAPEPIYEELLLHPAKAGSLSLPAPLDRVLANTTEFRRAARELSRVSLIKINPVRNVLQVHRVVQAVTYGQLQRENKTLAAQYRTAAHTLLAASDPNAPDRDDSDDAYERSRQHIVPSGALDSPDPLVRRLIRNQVRRLHRRGEFAESLSLGELALKVWQEKFGNDRDTLALAVEIGFPLRRTELDAERHQRSDLERADEAESSARNALAERKFDEAVQLLVNARELDPGRSERLRSDMNALSARPDDSPRRLAWRRGLWLALAAGSPMQLKDAESPRIAARIAAEADPEPPAISTPRQQPMQKKPQRAGADLEEAFIHLLERFFSLGADDERRILRRLRKQSAGTQFGHDIQFDCTVANSVVRCHVECKNYTRELITKDVTDKIVQMRTYWNTKKIDYFLIVTPRAGISNDLDLLIQTSNSSQDAPFQIQVWGPEEGIAEFFALEPAAYEAVYGVAPEPLPDVGKVVARWSGRLKPLVRLPRSLASYLRNPRMHCLPGEDQAHFVALSDDAIDVDVVDSAGCANGAARPRAHRLGQ